MNSHPGSDFQRSSELGTGRIRPVGFEEKLAQTAPYGRLPRCQAAGFYKEALGLLVLA